MALRSEPRVRRRRLRWSRFHAVGEAPPVVLPVGDTRSLEHPQVSVTFVGAHDGCGWPAALPTDPRSAEEARHRRERHACLPGRSLLVGAYFTIRTAFAAASQVTREPVASPILRSGSIRLPLTMIPCLRGMSTQLVSVQI